MSNVQSRIILVARAVAVGHEILHFVGDFVDLLLVFVVLVVLAL